MRIQPARCVAPLVLSLIAGLMASSAIAITVDPFYAGNYVAFDLGSVPDLPPLYGGLTFKYDDPDTLLIGGFANEAAGTLYAIGVVRDASNHVVGFSGTATFFAEAAYNDGGVIYGPDNVLFLARWPVNQLGQTKPGSTITDKIIDLTPFGVEESHSALNFVPADFPGAGRLKLVTWAGGQWNDVTILPDGTGTYNVVGVTEVPASRLSGGPEGFIFVPPNSPLFGIPSMLVSEFSAGTVASYELDPNGDPIVATRRTFITDLEGAEGATIDPLTGDFLFSTFGGGNRVIAVQGFVPPPQTGACCVAGGLCEVRTADECQGLGGTFKGVGTACANCLCTACAGDCNCDGSISFEDIDALIDALSGAAPCNFGNCDLNCDGLIDALDIDPFVAQLSAGAACAK